LTKENKNVYNHIAYFNPDVMLLESAYQDFLPEVKSFDAGRGYENFNVFIANEASE
jgi:hypothetical protein